MLGRFGHSLGSTHQADLLMSRGRNGGAEKGRKPELPHSQASGHTTRMLGCVAGGEVGMTRRKERSESGQMEPCPQDTRKVNCLRMRKVE